MAYQSSVVEFEDMIVTTEASGEVVGLDLNELVNNRATVEGIEILKRHILGWSLDGGDSTSEYRITYDPKTKYYLVQKNGKQLAYISERAAVQLVRYLNIYGFPKA